MLSRQLDRGGGLGSHKRIVHCAMRTAVFSRCRAVRPPEILCQWAVLVTMVPQQTEVRN